MRKITIFNQTMKMSEDGWFSAAQEISLPQNSIKEMEFQNKNQILRRKKVENLSLLSAWLDEKNQDFTNIR